VVVQGQKKTKEIKEFRRQHIVLKCQYTNYKITLILLFPMKNR